MMLTAKLALRWVELLESLMGRRADRSMIGRDSHLSPSCATVRVVFMMGSCLDSSQCLFHSSRAQSAPPRRHCRPHVPTKRRCGCFSSSCSCQRPLWVRGGTATLSGRVLDRTDGSPIGFASVIVEHAHSGEELTGVLTGEDGRFLVQGLAPAEYRIWTSFPGFHPVANDLVVGELNQSYDLGDIPLDRLEGFEEEITVTAEATRAAVVDSRVFRLDDGPTQSTGSLLDAMKNLPGVTVDQDGRVSLRGSDRVAILIDGGQSSLTGFGSQRGLDSVSAANIEAIEIIHNPSARFDAAGMAGIINIIYKQQRQLGLSGDVSLAVGSGRFYKQRDDLPTELGSFSSNPKIIPSLNLNYNTETIRSFVQGEVLFQDDLPNNEFTTRFYEDGRVIESQVPENRDQVHYITRLGSDWNIDDANTVSLSGVYDFETHTDRA